MIILSNLLFLTNNNSFYETNYKKENIYQNFQSVLQVQSATKELIGYLRGQNNLEDNLYSLQAKIHLKDVKSLIHLTSLVNYLSILVVAITVLYFLIRKKFKPLKRAIFIGSSATISIIFIIAISLLVNFDFIFTIFHKIFFNNNLWLFPEEDNLIKLFPHEFFMAFAYKLFLNILSTAFAFILVAVLFIKNDKLSN